MKSSRSPVIQAPSGMAVAFAFPRRRTQTRQIVERPGFEIVATSCHDPPPGIRRFPQLSEIYVEFSDFPPLGPQGRQGLQVRFGGRIDPKDAGTGFGDDQREPPGLFTGGILQETRRQSVERAACSRLRRIVGGQIGDSRRGPPFKGTGEPKTPWPRAATA